MEEESSKCVNLCDKSRNFLNENNMCENKRHHEHVEMPNNFNDEESANRKRSKREYLYDTNMQDGVSEAMTSSQIDLLGISPGWLICISKYLKMLANITDTISNKQITHSFERTASEYI